jgi:PIN domain nuclease of toxin-antitoxin system
MRLILDTHVLLWWIKDDPLLRPRVRAIIADRQNAVLVSVASFWELSIKYRKFGSGDTGTEIWAAALAEGFEPLPVMQNHLAALQSLALVANHGDPFDHLILAQAKAEGAAVITHDRHMAAYGVPCIGVR